MAITINEGSLVFTFPKDWRVIKYDETRFYRNNIECLGAELKAIDILVSPAPNFNSLLIIEVKDFRGHAVENRKRQASGELEKEILQKLLHTFSSLYISGFNSNEELEDFCKEELRMPSNIEYVFFMEEDVPQKLLEKENQLKRRQDIQLHLKGKLKKHTNVFFRILNIESIKPRDGWQVQ